MRNAKDYIIFPLDFKSLGEAQKYITLLSPQVGMFKVGLELFIRTGPRIIHMIHEAAGSAGIFLDLKLHDIPVTVQRAMRGIAELNVTFATVHCGESPRMLEAAVAGSGGKVGVLGVTILTSVTNDHIREAGFRPEFSDDLSTLVLKRAGMAREAGCVGVVCSGWEAGIIKNALGRNFLTVTPGIRADRHHLKQDDQQRIVTPSQAVQGGADYLVIGRPIRDADDPVSAAQRIAEEIEGVLP